MIPFAFAQYGVLSEVVSGVGSLVAAVGAISLGWRGRTRWEPSEQDIERGPQKVGSLLAAIAIAILWSQSRNPVYLPQLNKLALTLGIIAVVSLLLYGFMVNTFTYVKIVSSGKGRGREEKIIGGLWLSRPAQQAKERKEQSGKTATTQTLLAEADYNPDRVWDRPSRGLSKAIFVILYLALTVSGTVAIASASIILGLSQVKAPAEAEAAVDTTVYPWEFPDRGMPQLNREFNQLLNSPTSIANRLEPLRSLGDRHSPLIKEMEEAQKRPFNLSRPYKVVSLHFYLSMAYYQLATISLVQAEVESDTRLANLYRTSAEEYAKRCTDYAEEGQKWNQAVIDNDARMLSGNTWPPQYMKQSSTRLIEPQTAIARDLKWYLTAGRAIRAYYGRLPFEEVFPEVVQLKREYPTIDRPEDDPTMAWILTSQTGTRPQETVAQIKQWR
jgi:hypothetical protein